nr:tlde1 domain-containing protein [Paraburkholderia lacunae]
MYGADRRHWFILWREGAGDTTIINGIKRGAFRLHPMGPRGLSEGCITVVNSDQFNVLADYLHKHGATLPIPGTTLKAYGYVDVQ